MSTTYTIWLPNLSDNPGRSFYEFLPPRWDIPDPSVGTDGPDTLATSRKSDWLIGKAGIDVFEGQGGNDLLVGGAGDDVLRGGAAADIIEGGGGDDHLHGGSGPDILVGGKGKDKFHVSAGDGDLIADFQPGVDRIFVDGERVTLREFRLMDEEATVIEAPHFTPAVGGADQGSGALAADLVRLVAHYDDLLL